MGKITASDSLFIEKTLMTKFGIKRLRIKYSPLKQRWPDLWCSLNGIPEITVTDEWRRQSMRERRKRLVHEFIHISWQFGHGKVGRYDFNTVPELDTYSRYVYDVILRRPHV